MPGIVWVALIVIGGYTGVRLMRRGSLYGLKAPRNLATWVVIIVAGAFCAGAITHGRSPLAAARALVGAP